VGSTTELKLTVNKPSGFAMALMIFVSRLRAVVRNGGLLDSRRKPSASSGITLFKVNDSVAWVPQASSTHSIFKPD
jgi:hypothetical protein